VIIDQSGRSQRRYCDDCLPEVRERIQASTPSYAAPLDKERQSKKLSETMTHVEAAKRAWRETGGEPASPAVAEAFRSSILPKLQPYSTYAIAKVTGLSQRYAALIKRGEAIPHPRHLETLAAIDEGIAARAAQAPAKGTRSAANKMRRQERLEWERLHGRGHDVAPYVQQIQPHLAQLPLAQMRRATGLGETYCLQLKRGAVIPHPMHWEALAELAGVAFSLDAARISAE
jgi:hypothetical protein